MHRQPSSSQQHVHTPLPSSTFPVIAHNPMYRKERRNTWLTMLLRPTKYLSWHHAGDTVIVAPVSCSWVLLLSKPVWGACKKISNHECILTKLSQCYEMTSLVTLFSGCLSVHPSTCHYWYMEQQIWLHAIFYFIFYFWLFHTWNSYFL